MYDPAYNSGFDTVSWVIMIGMYLYFGYAQYRIAQKTGHTSPWWSYVPILNVVQWVQMANRPMWWFVLCLVPFINIIAFAVLWSDIAKAVGKPGIWGFVMLLPLLNFIGIGVLAFSAYTPTQQRVQPTPQPQNQPENVA